MLHVPFLALLLLIIVVCASARGQEAPASQQGSEPVRYRPIPVAVDGLENHEFSLDGAWRFDPAPGEGVRERPLAAEAWSSVRVPGQWLQQGFDVHQDQPVAMAREFTIPKQWAGYRIFLRFDAIHAGTDYWLNGKKLGYSENLFTPVEWEITDAAAIGETNRLDLRMTVNTASERMSYSSSYTCYPQALAGKTLGGIDRAVRVYALPKLQISTLRLNAGLDATYHNGELDVDLGIDSPDASARSGVEAVLALYDAEGRPVAHSTPRAALVPGSSTLSIRSQVPNPLKWNAEQPNLYKLVIELVRDGKVLEKIERGVGFRKVEIRDKQLYVNGVRVKLAGVCHHEIDPLTGRADTMRYAEDDVKLLKSANMNLVRTSHYPPTQEFLDAADRYGLYVESEAPFCWVQAEQDLTNLGAMLRPVSAMIDYNHSHPCVIIWSIANESHWCDLFDRSHKLCKQLDPTRPTAFEHAFSGQEMVTTDIISLHYQHMPYDDVLKDDPRPFLHGECFFLVYHERTDVAIDPGLREMWAHGSADPNSEWGKYCATSFVPGVMTPGIHPGAWTHIYDSKRVIGSEIWSGVDDISYLPDGTVVSSESGNAYWGLIDGWRRPKPELSLAKFVFSPVWFAVRQVEYKAGQNSVRIPVENRYSFTDLETCRFSWELSGEKGIATIALAPGSNGAIQIPVPPGTPEGAILVLRVTNGGSEIVNATIRLGEPKPVALPKPRAGAPTWIDDGKTLTVQGKGFSFVLDKTKGDFDATSPGHKSPIVRFPTLHVTRHEYNDLNAGKPPYAVFPDAGTRVVESVTATETAEGLRITVTDDYEHFAGAVTWVIDKNGAGEISYDYVYTGDDLDAREIGLMALLGHDCDEISWKRWSEWGIFPEDCICRPEGVAKARRDKKWPAQPVNVNPTWPWSQDETELGTNDFRSIKFCIYEASLTAPDGSGVRVNANADAHFRACLDKDGVKMHMLKSCPLGPLVVKSGDRLNGAFLVGLVTSRASGH